jgi:hypothetical protein
VRLQHQGIGIAARQRLAQPLHPRRRIAEKIAG